MSEQKTWDWKYILGGVVAAGAGLGIAYLGYLHVCETAQEQKKKKKCLDRIHNSFKRDKDAIIGYIYDASWNDFDRESLHIIYNKFSQLIAENEENGDKGYIKHDVFVKLADQAGLKDLHVVESLFKMFDEASDGRLDFMEVVECLDALCCTRMARLKRLFKLADIDRKGHLTRHNLRTLLRALCGSEVTEQTQSSGPPALTRAKSLNTEETSKIFALCDDDSSGTIDEAEFLLLACTNKIDFMAHGGFFRRFVALFGLDLDDYEATDM